MKTPSQHLFQALASRHQFAILYYLWLVGVDRWCDTQELIHQTGLNDADMSKSLRKLRKLGFVERLEPSHGRLCHYRLMPPIDSIMAQIDIIHQELESR